MTQTSPLDLVFFAFFVFFLKHQLVNLNVLLEIQSWQIETNEDRSVECSELHFGKQTASYSARDRTETRPCSLELDFPFRGRIGATETFHIPPLSQPFLLACLSTSAKGIVALANPTGNLLRC